MRSYSSASSNAAGRKERKRIAYTGAVREHVETPLRAELAKAENWKPVYEPKQLRIVAIKHKIG